MRFISVNISVFNQFIHSQEETSTKVGLWLPTDIIGDFGCLELSCLYGIKERAGFRNIIISDLSVMKMVVVTILVTRECVSV